MANTFDIPPSPGAFLNRTLIGGSGNDFYTNGGGQDSIDGGEGIDTVRYNAPLSQYEIVRVVNGGNTTYTVRDKVGADGPDTISNLERLIFSDSKLALDVAANQASGQAALLIGAVLPGKLYLDASKQGLLGSVIGLFDQGFSLQQLSGGLMRLPIWDVLTGKSNPTHTDIANYLLTNVNEVAPSASALQSAAAALSAQTGASQGDFLAQLAASTANQTHVGLVGLATTGLLFG